MPFHASEHHDPSLSFEYDVASGRWTCSPGIEALYGKEPGVELTTEHMLTKVVDEDRDAIATMFQRTLREAGAFSSELRVTDPLGRVRHCVLVGESEGTDGDVRRLVGFMVDISETLQRTAADAVDASAEHRATIEQAKGAIMVSFNLSEEAAFAVLQRSSQNSNVKLRQVAAGVLQARSSGPEDDQARWIKRWLEKPTLTS